MTARTLRLARGVALLEALIAAAVLGFGLLAVATLQFDLLADSDHAKQRSEAVQLAEQKTEQLRSFSQLAGYGGITSGTDTIQGTSAAYTRTWAIANSPIMVGGGTYPTYKDVLITVSWTGRGNESESVTLNSIIAMYDPASAGEAVVPPSGRPIRKPRNRSLDIPWPAVKLGGGTSAFHPPGSATGTAILFNDATGAVTWACTNAPLLLTDNTSGTPVDTSGWSCTVVNGYLLAGYIGVPTSNPPPINFHISVQTVANTSSSGTAVLYGCYDDIGPSGTGTQLYAGYVSYSCVINTAGSNSAWSGTTTFTGSTFPKPGIPSIPAVWGTDAGEWFVCRFPSGATAYPYVDVTRSLLNQNYVLVQGAHGHHAACPTISSVTTVQSYPAPSP